MFLGQGHHLLFLGHPGEASLLLQSGRVLFLSMCVSSASLSRSVSLKRTQEAEKVSPSSSFHTFVQKCSLLPGTGFLLSLRHLSLHPAPNHWSEPLPILQLVSVGPEGKRSVLTICSRNLSTCSVMTCAIVPCCGLAIQRIFEETKSSFR